MTVNHGCSLAFVCSGIIRRTTLLFTTQNQIGRKWLNYGSRRLQYRWKWKGAFNNRLLESRKKQSLRGKWRPSGSHFTPVPVSVYVCVYVSVCVWVCLCQCACSLLTAVCVHLDGWSAEHNIQVWRHMSCPFLNVGNTVHTHTHTHTHTQHTPTPRTHTHHKHTHTTNTHTPQTHTQSRTKGI